MTTNVEVALQNVMTYRNQIKEDFFRAWLASNLPEGADANWVLNNVQLVETWSADRLKVTWHFELKQQAGGP